MLAVTILDDQISDQPHLQNPEIDAHPIGPALHTQFGALESLLIIMRRLTSLPEILLDCVLNEF